jgi:hypothetical protein
LDASRHLALVGNLEALPGGRPFELGPGTVLRRATDEEIELLRKSATSVGGREASTFLTSRIVVSEKEGTKTYKARRWPQRAWRFYVVEIGSFDSEEWLQAAFDLSPVELEVLVVVPLGGLGVMYRPDRFRRALDAPKQPFGQYFQQPTKQDLIVTRSLFAQLTSLNDGAPGSHAVKRLTQQLSSVRGVTHPTLEVLGYFAILESVLTHAPKPSDPYDSITRQIKAKVALLNNRWQPKLDYSPFAGATPDTIWSRMYEYRSRLAHGGDPDFNKGALAVLGGREQALLLVKNTVKSLGRQLLVEPELIDDLRVC